MSTYPRLDIAVEHVTPEMQQFHGLPAQPEYYRAVRYAHSYAVDWAGPIRLTRAEAAADRDAFRAA